MMWQLAGVVLTKACNLRCQYCRLERGAKEALAWRTLQVSLDVLLRTAAANIEIAFTGGEPLLAFSTLRTAVEYVEQRLGPGRVRWVIQTNGLLLKDPILSFLDAHQFEVNLSFDGVPAAQELRGSNSYDALDRLLDHLRSQHPRLFRDRLYICVTLSPMAIPQLAPSVTYFLDKGVRTFDISPAKGDVEWRPNAIGGLEQQFEDVSSAVELHYRHTGEVPLVLFRKSVAETVKRAPAWSCRVREGQSPTIDVDGTTYACVLATSTYQPNPTPVMRGALEAVKLGPADAPDFEQKFGRLKDAVETSGVFSNPERRYSSYRKCADCEFLGRCHICPLASASIPGWDDMYRVSDFLCAFNQVALAARDRFPAQPTADDYFRGLVPLSALRFGGVAAKHPEP